MRAFQSERSFYIEKVSVPKGDVRMTLEENTMDIWQDVVNKRLDGHNVLIQQIRDQLLLDGHDIKNLKEDIKEIKDDTKWTRRAITNSFILGIIGGAVAVFYAALQLN